MEALSDASTRWIFQRTAAFVTLGAEPVIGLVTPTNEHFPDEFDGGPDGAHRLLQRVLGHAGLRQVPCSVEVVVDEEDASSSACSSGACAAPKPGKGKAEARVRETPEGQFLVRVRAAELRNPTVLTTVLARAVSSVFLRESGAIEDLERHELEPAIDLCGVLLGFGVLLGNGSYIYSKSCGGVRVYSATAMKPEDIGLALATVCELFQLPARLASRHLDPTPREHFEAGRSWVARRPSLLKRLRANPDRFQISAADLAPAKEGLVARLFGRRDVEGELERLERSVDSAASAPAAARDVSKRQPRPSAGEPSRPRQDLRAIVDEALDG